MIYSVDQIKHIHLEISSLCNAACPLCPRNFNGYPYNLGYTEHNMTLAEAKKIFSIEFVRQLKDLVINGNFGDAIMNPETVDIIKYFKEHNADIHVNISTNGGARNAEFWQELANLDVEVMFCIDGLDDQTHALYRRNTLYSTVIRNAQTFIAAGGQAIWKMIDFEHNQDQIQPAQQLSKDLRFARFLLVNDGRTNGPVYNKAGDLEYIIGPSTIGYEPPKRVDTLLSGYTSPEHKKQQVQWIQQTKVESPIYCEVAHSKSLYVSSTGDIFPCCYLGLNPQQYKNNSIIGYGLEQVSKLVSKNNALEYDLATCIEWFSEIEKTWTKPTFEDGRSVICNMTCGGAAKRPQFHVKNATYIDNTSESQTQV